MSLNNDFEDEALSEINVVPLVDIILVVLIIFMVTAPLIMKQSILVNLPKANSGQATQTTQLTIIMAGTGKMYIDNKEVDLEGILNSAKSMVIKNPEIQAIISADKEVAHGKVVSVMDTLSEGGIKKFGISTDKK